VGRKPTFRGRGRQELAELLEGHIKLAHAQTTSKARAIVRQVSVEARRGNSDSPSQLRDVAPSNDVTAG